MGKKGMILMWVKADDSNFHTQYRKLVKLLKEQRLELVDFEETHKTRSYPRRKLPQEKLYKARWERV